MSVNILKRSMNNTVSKLANYTVKPTTVRKLATHLNKAGVLLPVILLESTVTGGRTLQAYKRGGKTEARERICEESIGAVFWLFGVKVFNSIGNCVGKKFLGIETPEFSLAKDAVRDSFANIARNKNFTEADKKKYITFKFTKIAAAVVMASGLLGFVIPKVNQSITRKLLKKDEDKANKPQTPESAVGEAATATSVADFVNKVEGKTAQAPAFKGAIDAFAKVTNALENNDICKLLATDTGVLTGRAYNARNNDERIEIIFRDGASIYFYLKSTDHIIQYLNKRDGFGGKLSALDPVSARKVHNSLIAQLYKHQKGAGPINLEEMKQFAFGTNPQQVEQDLAKIKFKNGNILAFSQFEKALKDAGIEVDEQKLLKAKLFSEMQPERALDDVGLKGQVGRIITKQQVRDVLSDSVVSRPTFLRRVMKEAFDKNSSNVFSGLVEKTRSVLKLSAPQKDAFGSDLFNPYKYVSRDSIETLRNNIDAYVASIVEYAEKNEINELTPDLLKKVNEMNLRKNLLHIGAGLGVSALFLSTIIPKTQYFITKWRTGSDNFPGVK